MNKPALYVADIDGTLVNEARDLMPLGKEVIEIFHRNGVRFGIASGRALYQCREPMEEWGLSFPVDVIIGLNGSAIYDEDTKEVYTYDVLDVDTIKEILEIMRPFKDSNCFIYYEDMMWAQRADDQMLMSSKRHRMALRVVEDDSFFYKEPNAKLMFRFVDPKKLDECYEELEKMPKSDKYYYFRTQPTMLEFANPKTNKGNGLLAYCNLKGIDIKDVIAAGDMSNDNEMLKVAGLGICLKNGTEDTKACADVVTDLDNDHDGLAHYLMDNVIKPLGLK